MNQLPTTTRILATLALVTQLLGCQRATDTRLTHTGGGMTMSADMRQAKVQSKTTSSGRVRPAPTHLFPDGPRRRPLWLSTGTLIEFAPAEAGRNALLAHDPLARDLASISGGARVWKTSGASSVEQLAGELAAAGVRCSPAWQNVPGAHGDLLAFPGGVLIEFPDDWSSAEIAAWLSDQGLRETAGPLQSPHTVLVDSAAGLGALELANRLADEFPALRCWPNTWRSYVAM